MAVIATIWWGGEGCDGGWHCAGVVVVVGTSGVWLPSTVVVSILVVVVSDIQDVVTIIGRRVMVWSPSSLSFGSVERVVVVVCIALVALR